MKYTVLVCVLLLSQIALISAQCPTSANPSECDAECEYNADKTACVSIAQDECTGVFTQCVDGCEETEPGVCAPVTVNCTTATITLQCSEGCSDVSGSCVPDVVCEDIPVACPTGCMVSPDGVTCTAVPEGEGEDCSGGKVLVCPDGCMDNATGDGCENDETDCATIVRVCPDGCEATEEGGFVCEAVPLECGEPEDVCEPGCELQEGVCVSLPDQEDTCGPVPLACEEGCTLGEGGYDEDGKGTCVPELSCDLYFSECPDGCDCSEPVPAGDLTCVNEVTCEAEFCYLPVGATTCEVEAEYVPFCAGRVESCPAECDVAALGESCAAESCDVVCPDGCSQGDPGNDEDGTLCYDDIATDRPVCQESGVDVEVSCPLGCIEDEGADVFSCMANPACDVEVVDSCDEIGCIVEEESCVARPNKETECAESTVPPCVPCPYDADSDECIAVSCAEIVVLDCGLTGTCAGSPCEGQDCIDCDPEDLVVLSCAGLGCNLDVDVCVRNQCSDACGFDPVTGSCFANDFCDGEVYENCAAVPGCQDGGVGEPCVPATCDPTPTKGCTVEGCEPNAEGTGCVDESEPADCKDTDGNDIVVTPECPPGCEDTVDGLACQEITGLDCAEIEPECPAGCENGPEDGDECVSLSADSCADFSVVDCPAETCTLSGDTCVSVECQVLNVTCSEEACKPNDDESGCVDDAEFSCGNRTPVPTCPDGCTDGDAGACVFTPPACDNTPVSYSCPGDCELFNEKYCVDPEGAGDAIKRWIFGRR